MTTDCKALCAELLEIIDLLCEGDARPDCDIVARAHAYLAQPEPEGPTDEELLAIAAASIDGYQGCGIAIGEYEPENECAVEAYGSELITFARAVLARWGRPTIQPPSKPSHHTAQDSSQRP